MLTIKSASVIFMLDGYVYLSFHMLGCLVPSSCGVVARPVRSSCPVVARRAKSEAESDLWGRSSKSEAPSLKNEDGNLPIKKSSLGQTGELCPNLPDCPIARQKIKIDNKASFRYQVGCWFRLIDASICGAKVDADTQLTVFDLSDLKKQLLSAPSKFGASYGVKVSIG